MYKFSKKAVLDLENIVRYTTSNFGEQQSTKYLAELRHAIVLLSEFPFMGREYNENMLCHTAKYHSIFYKKRKNDIFIIRILSNRMNFSHHLN